MQFSIGPTHTQLAMITLTTPIIYGNGTMLSDIGEVTEVESTPGRKLPGPAERRLLKKQAQAQRSSSPVRSSPTIGYHAVTKRTKQGAHERKISIESTSTVKSEGQAAELFRDFDDGVSVDDSVFQGDDEESVADSYTEEVIASETARLSKRDSSIVRDDDRNSSAALSRRAEQILLNAKKRLNVGFLLWNGYKQLGTDNQITRVWRAISLELGVSTLHPLARHHPSIAAARCHERLLLLHKMIHGYLDNWEPHLRNTGN